VGWAADAEPAGPLGTGGSAATSGATKAEQTSQIDSGWLKCMRVWNDLVSDQRQVETFKRCGRVFFVRLGRFVGKPEHDGRQTIYLYLRAG
jgi:hypothetical protein